MSVSVAKGQDFLSAELFDYLGYEEFKQANQNQVKKIDLPRRDPADQYTPALSDVQKLTNAWLRLAGTLQQATVARPAPADALDLGKIKSALDKIHALTTLLTTKQQFTIEELRAVLLPILNDTLVRGDVDNPFFATFVAQICQQINPTDPASPGNPMKINIEKNADNKFSVTVQDLSGTEVAADVMLSITAETKPWLQAYHDMVTAVKDAPATAEQKIRDYYKKLDLSKTALTQFDNYFLQDDQWNFLYLFELQKFLKEEKDTTRLNAIGKAVWENIERKKDSINPTTWEKLKKWYDENTTNPSHFLEKLSEDILDSCRTEAAKLSGAGLWEDLDVREQLAVLRTLAEHKQYDYLKPDDTLKKEFQTIVEDTAFREKAFQETIKPAEQLKTKATEILGDEKKVEAFAGKIGKTIPETKELLKALNTDIDEALKKSDTAEKGQACKAAVDNPKYAAVVTELKKDLPKDEKKEDKTRPPVVPAAPPPVTPPPAGSAGASSSLPSTTLFTPAAGASSQINGEVISKNEDSAKLTQTGGVESDHWTIEDRNYNDQGELKPDGNHHLRVIRSKDNPELAFAIEIEWETKEEEKDKEKRKVPKTIVEHKVKIDKDGNLLNDQGKPYLFKLPDGKPAGREIRGSFYWALENRPENGLGPILWWDASKQMFALVTNDKHVFYANLQDGRMYPFQESGFWGPGMEKELMKSVPQGNVQQVKLDGTMPSTLESGNFRLPGSGFFGGTDHPARVNDNETAARFFDDILRKGGLEQQHDPLTLSQAKTNLQTLRDYVVTHPADFQQNGEGQRALQAIDEATKTIDDAKTRNPSSEEWKKADANIQVMQALISAKLQELMRKAGRGKKDREFDEIMEQWLAGNISFEVLLIYILAVLLQDQDEKIANSVKRLHELSETQKNMPPQMAGPYGSFLQGLQADSQIEQLRLSNLVQMRQRLVETITNAQKSDQDAKHNAIRRIV